LPELQQALQSRIRLHLLPLRRRLLALCMGL
jgi:hypothetical protein